MCIYIALKLSCTNTASDPLKHQSWKIIQFDNYLLRAITCQVCYRICTNDIDMSYTDTEKIPK